MLKEARIVMPMANDGFEQAHAELRHKLCVAFGGFTAFAGQGCWQPEGSKMPIYDTVTIYDVAIDSDRDSPYDTLAQIAVEAGRALGQQSVYVRYPNGNVDIIDLTKPRAEVKPKAQTKDDAARFHETMDRPDPRANETTIRMSGILSELFGAPVFVDGGMGEPEQEHETLKGVDTGRRWLTRSGAIVTVGQPCVSFGGFFVDGSETGPYVVSQDGKMLPHIPGIAAGRDLLKYID